jgi:hypothetical protein
MRSTFSVVFLVSLALLTPASSSAQTSELYLTDATLRDTFVVQGGVIIRQFDRSANTDGPGLAVGATIKCIGVNGGEVGHEYALDGTPLAGTYPNPSFQSLLDGATDGVHTWSIAHNDSPTNFALVQGDADWGNLQVLFVPQRRSSGVTYDSSTGTLWVTNTAGGISHVQQYDFAGGMLQEFPATEPGGGYGIAWDPADDTLWIPASFGNNDLYQYDKAGNLLQVVDVLGLTDSIAGAEFVQPRVFGDGFESGDTSAWSASQGAGPGPATCAELYTTMDVWGLPAEGLDLRSRTGSTLHWLGCPTDGCDPGQFYCNDDPGAQTLAFGTNAAAGDSLRTLVDPGDAIGDTIPSSFSDCCSPAAPNDICNAPDNNCNGEPVDCIEALCHALGYQNGVIIRAVPTNFCPESHALDTGGTDWTSDFVESDGYGAEYLCSGFLP